MYHLKWAMRHPRGLYRLTLSSSSSTSSVLGLWTMFANIGSTRQVGKQQIKHNVCLGIRTGYKSAYETQAKQTTILCWKTELPMFFGLFVCRFDILFCHIYQQFNGVPQGRPLCPCFSWSVYQPLPTKEVATISPCLSLSSSLPQQLVMQFKCSRLHSFCQWFIWASHMGAVEQINGSLRAWTCIGHRVSANTVGSV